MSGLIERVLTALRLARGDLPPAEQQFTSENPSRVTRAYQEMAASLREYRLAQLRSLPEDCRSPEFILFWMDDDRFLEAMMDGVRAKSVLDFEPANPSEPSLLAITA